MRFRGVVGLRVVLNRIAGVENFPISISDSDTPSGIHLRTVKGAALHLNAICGVAGAPAVRFADTGASARENIVLPGFFAAGNQDVKVSLNRFAGYDPDVCVQGTVEPGVAEDGVCFGPVNADGGGNAVFLNHADSDGDCPSAGT
jgi:hypothetical protein